MAELVSKTYSQALFEVAQEENKHDIFLEEMKFVVSTCNEYPKFYELLKTPKIGITEKKQILDDLFKNKISNEIINFIKIILDKRRVKNLFSIVKEFENMIYEHKGIVKAEAFTTIPLTDDEKQKLQDKLSQITSKSIELKNTIDESLIGGVLIKIGDKVIDGTIKSRLKELEDSLAQIIV